MHNSFSFFGSVCISSFFLFFFACIFLKRMDETTHPLAGSPPTKMAESPLLGREGGSNSRDNIRTQFEQAPSSAFRGRSKSLASYGWTVLPPRLPMDYYFGPEGPASAAAAAAAAAASLGPTVVTNVPYKARSWEPTLEKAIKAIVSIKASHVRSFDTETSG